MLLKNILEKKLKNFAKKILKKQRPQILVITGSIGKTSTREAIYQLLTEKFKVRESIKNYNNEIGVPLTILGSRNPEKSLFGWLKVFLKAFFLTLFRKRNYPQILILEMAADKPGDLRYLMEIIPRGLLKVVVLTAVAPTHLEFFGSIENIFKEKIIPFSYLSKTGLAVVNKDNCDFEKIKPLIASKIITYGIEKPADIKVSDISLKENGLEFKLNFRGKTTSSFLKDGISKYQLYPVLAAAGLGIFYGMDLEQISEGLKKYRLLRGRMRKIEGKRDSIIIDDTYNSSPEAARRALEALAHFPFGKRKIAVLGDMLELGQASEKLHRQIGRVVAELRIDYLITFGKKAKYIFDEARKAGFPPDQSFQFEDFDKVSDLVENLIKPGDVLLIKGSRAMKMEKIVKKIMARPEMAKDLLVN